MKKITLVAAVAFATIMSSFKPADKSTWALDGAHAKLGFSISHLSVSEVEGNFKKFDAKIMTSGADFTDAEIEFSADIASVNTDNEKRDEHLRGGDFFDASKFPQITFKSTSVKKNGKEGYKIKGDLTMHGVTKPVELTATCKMGTNPMNNNKTVAGFKITGKIKRTNFGVGNMPAAMVGDEVTITANGEFYKD